MLKLRERIGVDLSRDVRIEDGTPVPLDAAQAGAEG